MAQRRSCAFPNEKLQAARTVLSAQDFYDYADEHFGWAETARTERERAIFFQMAAAWLEVAQRWETPEGGAPRSYVSIEATAEAEYCCPLTSAYRLRRANSRTTVVACHSPPRGASTARLLSSSAILRMLVMP